MIALLCLPIAILAAIGFVASTLVSLSFWLGSPLLPEYHDLLLTGIFVVHVPTVLVIIAASRGREQPRSWNELLRGAPVWVGPALVAVGVYAGVNFFLGFFGAFETSGDDFFRIGSSHAMVFYGAGFGLNLAVFNRRDEPPPA